MDDKKIMDMIDDNPGFTESPQPVIIKVLGVGGGGDNAINHMYSQDIQGVSFVVCNTDRQALEDSPVPTRLLLGPKTCMGLGAGNDPEVARVAAEESAAEISSLFDDGTQMVFITAGMGGGTGTGAAPVVARLAQEKGVLTIGIVTIPFLFEGQKKILKALKGADELGKYVDALLIINNERLTEIYPDLDFDNAFAKADDTLSIAARSISELITKVGRINLDFKDVNTTLRKGGAAIISSGYGEGENRVTKAIKDALNSPLLKNRDVYSAQRILINTYISPNAQDQLKMSEMNELRQFMCNFDQSLDVIFGQAYDDTLDDRVKITVLAAGFNVTNSIIREAGAFDNIPIPAKEEPKVDDSDDQKRLLEEYGIKIREEQLQKAAARYLVLNTEDIENDDIIDLLEKTPTYGRGDKFKETISNLRATAQQGESKAAEHSTTPTISFGD